MGTTRLQDKVAIVTGASHGIGRAISLRLADEGMRLILAARTVPALESLAEEVRQRGGEAEVVKSDLFRHDDLHALAQVPRQHYDGQLDLLVNNAGGSDQVPVIKGDAGDLDWVLNLNLRALVVLTQFCLPMMADSQGGTIVNIGSMAGVDRSPGMSAYSAAKAGVLGWTESLFEEVRRMGIKVSAVCPGFVDNRREYQTQGMEPEDVAEAVYYVAASGPRVCPTRIHLKEQRDPHWGEPDEAEQAGS